MKLRFTGTSDPVFEQKIRAAHEEAMKRLETYRPLYRSRLVWPDPALENARQVLERLHETSFVSAPGITVHINPRMRSRGGSARSDSWSMQMNHRLLSDHPEEITKTYLHELAHILADQLHAKFCKHDENWRHLAVAIGDDGGRCHSMDASAYQAKRKKYAWTCGCPGYTHEVGKTRHFKMLANRVVHQRSGYRCRDCGQSLEPTAAGLVKSANDMSEKG